MKSEKEKMLEGSLYDSSDKVLMSERDYAKDLIYEFNHTRPNKRNKKDKILKELLNLKGSCFIEAPFYCDYGYNIEVGDHFYANHGCIILDVNQVKIGEHVMLGPNVQIYTATHPVNPTERLTGKEYAKSISIGDNVWIGGGTIICPGVKIGNNVTIGAGSVVTKDIPDSVIAVGNPCKIIKEIK